MKLFETIKTIGYKAKYFYDHHEADILVGAGIVSVIAGVVSACIGARKVDDILDEHEYEIDDVKTENAEEPMEKGEYNREVAKVYGKTGLEFAKAFAPAAVLLTTGIGLILKSHAILKDDKLKLIAAYNVLDASFREYRERVKEKYGEDEERRIRFGAKEIEKEVEIEGKDGKKRKKKEKIDVYPSNCSEYARVFDWSNVNFQREETYGTYALAANFQFLTGIEEMCNAKLRIRGQMTLNEVYRELCMPPSQAGNVVGWRTKENGGKDGVISFGIKDRNACIVLSDGCQEAILLDFNVDGVILDDKYDKISGTDALRP